MTSLTSLVVLGAFISVVSSTGMDGMYPKFPGGRNYRRNPDEDLASYWRDQAQAVLAVKVAQPLNTGVAKNVVLFLGDGMSVPTLTAARALKGQRAGASGEEAALSFEQFPYSGLSKTYCVDSQVPDSACTATAFLTGVKGNLGTIGITASVNRSDCVGQADTTQHVESIVRWSQDAGKATGIVTSSRITHSTPGGAYAHIVERNWESDADVTADGGDVSVCEDLASQLVTDTTGRQIKVLLGGGRSNLLPETVTDEEGSAGRRQDQRNLIDEWTQDKVALGVTSAYVWNKDQLLAIDVSVTDYVLGLFEGDHMRYHAEADPNTEPTLAEMTEVAIRTLQKEANGFFLLVEGARVDMAHHDNMAYRALDETLEMAAAVDVATRLTSESDTLIVVTGDHSHTMSLSGYGARGNDILGLAGKGSDQFPYPTLSYANGPGFHDELSAGSRYNITQDDTTATDYKFPAMNPLATSAHGGDDVTIHSRGPWAHLLTGTLEQNVIAHAMAYASCVGTGATACSVRDEN